MCLIPTNTQDWWARRRWTAWPSRLRLSALLVVLVVKVVSARALDWPQFRGPNRDGVWKETGIMQSFPPDGLKTSWRGPVGPGWSSPVVAHGRVYRCNEYQTEEAGIERSFKTISTLARMPTARTRGTTPVEPKRATLQIPGRAIREQTTAQTTGS